MKKCIWLTLLLALSACTANRLETPNNRAPSTNQNTQTISSFNPEFSSGWTAKTLATAKSHMVSSANPLATAAGLAILDQGGSATDAAIAIQMLLTLVEPQSSGIGGGAFMLHYAESQKKLTAYDGRETAPAAATSALFLDANGKPLGFASRVGGRATGTPGVLRMLELAHQDYGRLPWAKLFEPAIALADNGFALSPRLYAALQGDVAGNYELSLATQAPANALFFDANRTPKAIGSIIKNPALGDTFRLLAAKGASAFYEGEIAHDIVAKVHAHNNPGVLTSNDLRDYKALRRDPLCKLYRQLHNICTVPPPSSAIGVLMALGILERFDLKAMGADSLDATHTISEAYRLIYADRAAYTADPDFVKVPVSGLLDKDYLASRSALISIDKSMGTAKPGRPPGVALALNASESPEMPATTHFSIVDSAGNAVSITSSVEAGFGSKQMVRGFFLNNQLTDFSFAPINGEGLNAANGIEANKRPRSAMSPTMVFDIDGRLKMVVGSPGGTQILQFVTKTLIGALDWNLNAQEAVNTGHFGAQVGRTTYLERGTAVAQHRTALEARGHNIVVTDLNSGIHTIMVGDFAKPDRIDALAPEQKQEQNRKLTGGADPRREGVAAGR
jgi:gamma-glutamyltranspeptidase / glutathione hydrolase